MLKFPDEFPIDALAVLGPVIRSGGTITDKVAVGEALLTLQGYGLGQWLGPSQSPHTVGALPPEYTATLNPTTVVGTDQAQKALVELEATFGTAERPRVGAQAPNVGKIDTKKIGKFALEIVKFILPFLLAL